MEVSADEEAFFGVLGVQQTRLFRPTPPFFWIVLSSPSLRESGLLLVIIKDWLDDSYVIYDYYCSALMPYTYLKSGSFT